MKNMILSVAFTVFAAISLKAQNSKDKNVGLNVSINDHYAKADSLLKTTIQTIAGHYKGKVRGWDVINEMFSDGPAGAIRNNTNTTNATANEVFV